VHTVWNPENPDYQDRNTNDVMADIFVASQVEVREMLTNVLVNSAKSIPLLLPSDPPELCLWQFRNVVKTWQERAGAEVKFMEERIFNF